MGFFSQKEFSTCEMILLSILFSFIINFYIFYFSILCHLKLLGSRDQNPAGKIVLYSGKNNYVSYLYADL